MTVIVRNVYEVGGPFLDHGRRERVPSYSTASLDARLVYLPLCRDIFAVCRISFRLGPIRALVHALYGRVRKKATGMGLILLSYIDYFLIDPSSGPCATIRDFRETRPLI